MSLERAALDNVIEEFWAARARGVYFPPAWQDRLDLDDAYRIQLALVARRCTGGVSHVGFKVGLTAKAIQEQFKVHEPVFGCLLSEGRIASGHVFRHADLLAPGFENEICVVLGRDLAGAELSVAEVARAVDRAHPALEIIETRGDLTRQLALALADNAQQKFFVLGAPVRLADDLDLSAIGVRVHVNGAEVGGGRGDAVLGHPLRSVAWLAGKLAAYGRGLKAGDHVMTGSFTRQFPLARGDRVRVEFERVGAVEAAFE
jgi:2-keto-4-pentenoate hydratase